MAQAIDKSSTPPIHVPQGMCLLRDILSGPYGDEHMSLRSDLASDFRWAFGLGPDGLIRIPVSYWVAPGAITTLESGVWMHCRPDGTYAALPVAVLCAEAPEATDHIMPEYIPPFVALMLEAVREFGISAANPSPAKKRLTGYFEGRMVEGQTISPNLADTMATLCRSPAAMRGGNKR
jgi:hypothetical protein